MDRSLQILNRSYTRFLETIGTKSIESYFEIENYSIQCVRQNDRQFILTIQSKLIQNVYVLNQTKLSPDIIQHIYAFLENTLYIVSEITCSTDYPFKPHTWVVMIAYKIIYNNHRDKVCKHSILSKLALPVAFYNKQLIDSWMTSPLFENHILCYITHILSLV